MIIHPDGKSATKKAESADFLINRRSRREFILSVSFIFVADGAKTELRSVTDVCDTFGITRMVLATPHDMLDHTPQEITAILRETC